MQNIWMGNVRIKTRQTGHSTNLQKRHGKKTLAGRSGGFETVARLLPDVFSDAGWTVQATADASTSVQRLLH